MTGKPCKNGHIAKRLTSNGQCTACSVEKARRFRDSSRDVALARTNAWRDKNRTAYLAKMAEFRAGNREYFKAYNRKYQKENPGVFKEKGHRRRYARIRATPTWYGEFDAFVMLEAADLCILRRDKTGFEWHIDHMVPLRAKAASGLHCAANIQVIPASINIVKQNKMIFTEVGEWLKSA
jgi:hypothetical protein